MGSGKGKSRRGRAVRPQMNTQTVAAPGTLTARDEVRWLRIMRASKLEVGFDMDVWRRFIAANGLSKVNVYKYYQVSVNSALPLRLADYERVLTELFADAVTVGAIVLPGAYKPEDFEFRVGTNLLQVLISRTASKDKEMEALFCPLGYRMRSTATVSSVSFVVQDLARKVEEFLALCP